VAKKLERWNKISREAAMQSQRGSIPAVRAVGSYNEAINEAAAAELPLFLYEGKCKVGLLDAMKNKDGYVMVFVLVVLIVLCITSVSLLTISLQNLKAQENYNIKTQEYYLENSADIPAFPTPAPQNPNGGAG
jgi:hypothetical protein